MDFDRIYMLLSVAEKAAGHPKLKNILVAAQMELEEIANPQVPVELEEENQAPEPNEPPIGDVPNGRRV